MGNSFGHLFRITTFGESHGAGVGVIVDGCPSGLEVDLHAIQAQLARRRPGQSRLTTQRQELDQVEVLSGLADKCTLGTPIAMLVRNSDARSKDYAEMASKYRPSHADYTYDAKYGVRAAAGGGRASARETVGRVAAGALAEQVLARDGIEIVAWVQEVAGDSALVNTEALSRAAVDSHPTRCPDAEASARFERTILEAKKAGDSVGGVVQALARNVPTGLGAPVFDKLDADLAKAMISLPAAKGFEIGSGFSGTSLRGTEHNDTFYMEGDRVRTRTNRSGGIQGGISNGEDIVLRVAFKPTATVLVDQPTVTNAGQDTILKPRGRHDPCVLPRAVAIVEAMFALVLTDHLLRHRAIST